MAIVWLDHVNLRTSNLEAMRKFYVDVVGLDDGPRPDFGFPGAWLYCGERATVHLVQTRLEPAGEDPKLEHFAFRTTDVAEIIARMEKCGVAYTVVDRPQMGILQVNIYDPDGNHIELAFPPVESQALPKHARPKPRKAASAKPTKARAKAA
jgi:catechol 2,3-dioxygenase-like lactoylglutathione lyase family enzyme